MAVTLCYDEEHGLLRREARRWLSERCPIDAVRRLADDARGDDPTVWQELANLGWLGLVIPERHGGLGLSATHSAVLFEETGRRLLPSPLLPATLAALLIERAGSEAQKAAWLPRLASGERLVALAHVEPSGLWRANDTTVRRQSGRLSGGKHQVWAGATADALLVPFVDDAVTRFALIDCAADGVQIEAEIGLDTTRRSARVVLRNVAVAEADILPADAGHVFDDVLPRALVALAAEMTGGADALLIMTAEYAKTRVQFGGPIGRFQALKHPLVNLLVGVEQARSLVYAAASALDTGAPDAELLARMAKAHCSDLYVFAASRAVQFHGGFGFTIDCDVHFYFKRAQASRPAFGDAAHHRRWIADRLITRTLEP